MWHLTGFSGVRVYGITRSLFYCLSNWAIIDSKALIAIFTPWSIKFTPNPDGKTGSSLSAGKTNSSSRFHFAVRHFFDPTGCRSI